MPLIAVASSPDPDLVLAFEENEFDIAGLADLSLDDANVDVALRELFLILAHGTEPRRSNRTRLARTLLAMFVVARQDYAGSGHQEYWPFLFDRIEDAAAEIRGDCQLADLRSQDNQVLLGKWFRLALDEFGYTIPEGGQRYVSPVIFHAGIPKNSLPGALHLIDTAVQQYGAHAVTLPHDVRAKLAQNHFPALHRNTERLLGSQLRGAAQLWSCLARVVLAWQSRSDFAEELRRLPTSLDPEDVRRSLPSKRSTEAIRQTRTALPQLRFDSETGEVRLTAPSGTASDWSVTAGGRTMAVCWTQTHAGLSAELLAPPPEEISIALRGSNGVIGRTIATRPAQWPGIWFHASNGNIEDGVVIDANGLEPGRWFVLFEGTPTRWNVPSAYRVPLKWSCFAEQTHWTAWEIEVPARSSDRPSLEWFVDDNHFHVPLSRRPGTRVELCLDPIASAWNAAGETIATFSEAPTVRLCRDRSVDVQLLRETTNDLKPLRSVELPPDEPWTIPIREPGIYQLREARGVGRLLLHFAVIPGLRVTGPIYDASQSRVAIEIGEAAGGGGVFTVDEEPVALQRDVYRHEQTTVEPNICLEWRWSDESTSPLKFQWSVEGLRWRVLRLSDQIARWTREPIFVSPGDVRNHDAQLEIQAPTNSALRVNQVVYSEKLHRGRHQSGVTLSLLPFGDLVEVGIDGEELRPAVVLSDRPVLNHLEALSDGTAVVISWDSRANRQGTVIVAWNSLEPLAAPIPFSLTDEQLRDGACEIPYSQLPGEFWTSLTVARSVRIGLSRQLLLLAITAADSDRPVSILLNRESGRTVFPNSDTPENWAEFLHGLTLARLDRRPVSTDQVAGALERLAEKAPDDIASVLGLYAGLDSEDVPDNSTSAVWNREWKQGICAAIERYLGRQVQHRPSLVFESAGGEGAAATLEKLLRMGIPVGQSCPIRWLSHDDVLQEYSCAYPFRFIRDLWILGACEVDDAPSSALNHGGHLADFAERRKQAAERVWAFLQSREMTFINRLLPVSQAVATAAPTDCGHNHSFALPPRTIAAASDFADVLGIDDLALDCDATSDDPLWDDGYTAARGVWHSPTARQNLHSRLQPRRRNNDYSLFWSSSERKWYIERLECSPPTCCSLSKSPLVAAPPAPSKLIADVDLRQILDRWVGLDSPRTNPVQSSNTLERLVALLAADPVTGALHRELLTAVQAETKTLFGAQVSVATQSGLAERARIAWLMAWVDRLSAWKGARPFFADEPASQGLHGEFLQALGKVCSAWPRLMERCFALAEFLIWTYYRGGIGTAMRFQNPNAARRRDSLPAATPLTAAQSSPANSFAERTSAGEEVVVADAAGVIIACDGRTGRILVKHPSSPSLSATVKAFVDSRPDAHCWQVDFPWQVIGAVDRKKIEELYAAKRRSHSSPASDFAELLCGLTVRCELRKKAKWEVVAMHVVFNGQRFLVPARVR